MAHFPFLYRTFHYSPFILPILMHKITITFTGINWFVPLICSEPLIRWRIIDIHKIGQVAELSRQWRRLLTLQCCEIIVWFDGSWWSCCWYTWRTCGRCKWTYSSRIHVSQWARTLHHSINLELSQLGLKVGQWVWMTLKILMPCVRMRKTSTHPVKITHIQTTVQTGVLQFKFTRRIVVLFLRVIVAAGLGSTTRCLARLNLLENLNDRS